MTPGQMIGITCFVLAALIALSVVGEWYYRRRRQLRAIVNRELAAQFKAETEAAMAASPISYHLVVAMRNGTSSTWDGKDYAEVVRAHDALMQRLRLGTEWVEAPTCGHLRAADVTGVQICQKTPIGAGFSVMRPVTEAP